MSEKDENSLIGYDPLAWMGENRDEYEGRSSEEEFASVSVATKTDEKPFAAFEQDAVMIDTENEEQEQPAWQLNTEASGGSVKELFMLDAVHNMQNINELYDKLKDALDRADKLEIDASEVSVIDTSSLQLLVVLKRTALNLQKHVSIDFPSERFIEAAELLGVSQMLEVEQVSAGFF